MFYRELKDIDFVSSTRGESIKRLKDEFGINAPNLVIEQFYLDHNNNDSFLELYGNIDLRTIKWALVEVSTENILAIDDAATCPDFVKDISENATLYNERGDEMIDIRNDVIQGWKNNGTWITPPIFIDGTKLKKQTKKLHLVEGHTRVGNLKGIVTNKLFELADFHKIYYGAIT